MIKITSIGTAVPSYKITQEEAFQAVKEFHCQDASQERVLKYVYTHSGIDTRYTILKQYKENTVADFIAHDNSVEARMKIYTPQALDLAEQACRKACPDRLQEITHVITISCTGMCAPGLDLLLVKRLGLRSNTQRTSINFMGCYAAIHGMKQAQQILAASPEAKVLVVSVELCSLHFQTTPTDDHITSSIIFGDGAAAFLAEHSQGRGLVLKNFYSDVINDGADDMQWHINSTGFLMKLSDKVAEIIKKNAGSLISDALKYYGLERDSIQHWSIHPGGKKILDAIAKSLFLQEENMLISRSILKEYGNMSSATILFVLERFLAQSHVEQGSIIGMGFGPGLVIETFHLEYVAD
jgi:predicted naringenin-chalcone synthase